ncbi:CACTA en-spm transposon protein [Cucumis melo var. makuwa]|uniref:CACTA en-spm transposon protein n=1 Tax=Cucumis melo var. makuwa TaxID=1194695 RepID=A0A5A7T966_CUCMM|nr:CACTA en-spm transposon protein [Cucumis melo var. makuwa]TYK31359.1 CACTA en-spm transposon protein [Cucumis melo var. makuwa]
MMQRINSKDLDNEALAFKPVLGEMISEIPTKALPGHPKELSATVDSAAGLAQHTNNHAMNLWQPDRQCTIPSFPDQEHPDKAVSSGQALPRSVTPQKFLPSTIPTADFIGSGVPYSSMNPLDIPTLIPPSNISPFEVLERVSKWFKEIGEVNPSEGPMSFDGKDNNRNREGKREEKPRGEKRESSSPFRVSPPSLAAVQPPSATLAIMSYQRSNFMETDDMFLQFEDDLDNNIARGSSSVGDNTAESSSQQSIPTPRRRAQSRLLELERHVAINGRIPMTITPGAEKPISPHVVHFSQAIGVCMRKTFSVRCLKWADVGREYIEVFKDDLQMLTTFKEFRAGCHRHFKKYSDPEEARANPPNALVGRDEDCHFLCDHYISRAFQYELAERKGEPIDRVELFRETHVRAGTFVSQDAHNQMLELQSQPTPEGSQPLSEDEICDQVLGRRPSYSKGLG